MTQIKSKYTERAFRAAFGRKVLSVLVGRISADSVERWLDLVSVDGTTLLLSRRVALMTALHLMLANIRRPA